MMPSEHHPHNICVIGNIASGKSTLARRLGESFENSLYIPEVFERNPFLPLSLVEPARWAFTNLIYYFWDYARIYTELTRGHDYQFQFIDAGIWTNSLFYGRYLAGEGVITAEEYSFYQTLSELVLRVFPCPDPIGFIALNTSPETCWARMQQRGWDFQTSTVDLPYLHKLARYHEEMKHILARRGFTVLEFSSEELDYADPAAWREALARVERLLQAHHPAHA
jgi:deoxyadenosine/deoxycytidine kinase